MSKSRYAKAELLSDKPIILTGKDRLSFRAIVQSIIELIALPEKPFTFGLFGKWGTGKSTILKDLETQLDMKDHYVVTFDAWKYEGDALRRSFLIDIAHQLNDKKIKRKLLPDTPVVSDEFVAKLEADTYTDRSESKSKPVRSVPKLLIFLVIFLVLLAIQIVLSLSDDQQIKYLNQFGPLATTVVLAVSSVLLGLFPGSTVTKLFIKEINVNTSKLDSPEVFYTKFKEILTLIEGTILLVIIDNLDRTQKEATVELLGTIKTYLNADRGDENVIFLIASDDKAIRRHIQAVYSGDSENAYESDEFLKKFFNAVIEIPPTVSSEYRDFILDLLQESKLNLTKNEGEDIVGMIMVGFPDNPRGAKQYINSLIVYLKMISRIGRSGGIDESFINNNLNFIAVMLMFRDRFIEVYEYIQNESVTNDTAWVNIKDSLDDFYLEDAYIKSKGKNKDFKRFISSVESWVSPSGDSIKWYFNMRRSNEEAAMPNWDSFISSVNKQDHENAITYLREFYKKDPLTLERLLTAYTSSVRSQPSKWTPFVSVFLGFTSIEKMGINSATNLKSIFKEIFRFFPPNTELAKISNNINLEELMNYATSDFVSESETTKVRTSVTGYIKSIDDFSEISKKSLLEIMDFVISAEPSYSGLKTAISHAIGSSAKFFEDIDIMRKVSHLQSKGSFTSQDFMIALADSISEADLSNTEMFETKLEIDANYKKVSTGWTNKLIEIGTWLQNNPEQTSREIYSKYLLRYLKAIKRTSYPDLTTIQTLTSYLYDWYNSSPSYENKVPILLLLIFMGRIEDNQNQSLVGTAAEDFFSNADISSQNSILQRVVSDPDAITNSIKTTVINRIPTKPEVIESIILKYPAWFPVEKNTEVFTTVLSSLQNVSDDQFIDVIDRMLMNRDAVDFSIFQSSLYATFQSNIDYHPSPIATYVRKRLDNPLEGHQDWILDIKRKIKSR